jgi:broad specificity phosphatase PhoE
VAFSEFFTGFKIESFLLIKMRRALFCSTGLLYPISMKASSDCSAPIDYNPAAGLQAQPSAHAKASFHTVRILSRDDKIPLPDNVKIIHWVRHGQGIHNVAGEKDRMFGYLKEENEDALLTDKGKQQCKELERICIPNGIVDRASLLVVSPMHRTIQTATYSFPNLIGTIPWIALENLRETTGLHPCDRRRPITEHMEHYPHIDFSLVLSDDDPLYHQYTCEREPDAHVALRARKFLEWLANRQEKEIIVVTHSAFLRALFRLVLDAEESEKAQFSNCELRSYLVTLPKQK